MGGGVVKSHYTRNRVKALMKRLSRKDVINRMRAEDVRDKTVHPPQFIAWSAVMLALADSHIVQKWIFRAYCDE